MRALVIPMLGLLACARDAAPAPTPTSLVEARPVVAVPLGSSTAAVELAPTIPSCKTPCLVTNQTVDMLARDDAIVFLRTFGQQGRAQLLERSVTGTNDVELAADVRPPGVGHVYRMRGDARTLVLATDKGLATWDRTTHALALLTDEPKGVFNAVIDGDTIVYMGGDCILKQVARTGGPVKVLAKSTGTYCSLPLLALDSTDVYFVPDKTVYAVPRAGGAIRKVLADPTRYVLGIAVDGQVGNDHAPSDPGDSLYLLTSPPLGQRDPRQGRVLRISKHGGRASVLAQTEAAGNAYTLTFDATKLYWVESSQNQMNVVSLPKSGGTRVTLAATQGLPYGIAASPSSIYFIRWIMDGSRGRGPEVFRVDK